MACDEAGIKSVTMEIEGGEYAYGFLLGGVHKHLYGVVDKRRHEHAGEARHALALCVERRHANQTVHAVLALQEAVGIFAAFNLHKVTVSNLQAS